MRNSEAMLTISRRNSNQDDNDTITVCVTDSLSGNRVVEIILTPENFTKCITGLSCVDADYKFCPTPEGAVNYKKKRIVDSWLCDKLNISKERQAVEVRRDFAIKNDGEWILHSDGIHTQQKGTQHRYVVVRYE